MKKVSDWAVGVSGRKDDRFYRCYSHFSSSFWKFLIGLGFILIVILNTILFFVVRPISEPFMLNLSYLTFLFSILEITCLLLTKMSSKITLFYCFYKYDLIFVSPSRRMQWKNQSCLAKSLPNNGIPFVLTTIKLQ